MCKELWHDDVVCVECSFRLEPELALAALKYTSADRWEWNGEWVSIKNSHGMMLFVSDACIFTLRSGFQWISHTNVIEHM